MQDYRTKLEDFIRRETIQIRDKDLTQQLAAQISQFTGKGARGLGARRKLNAKCPVCGGDIVTTPFGYGCDRYQKDGSGCRFVIGSVAGRDLTDEEVIDLLSKGRTQVLSGFTAKNKKKFQAALVLQKDEDGKINISFDFSENQPQVLEGVKCPDCGSPMEIKAFGYGCMNFDAANPESCHFAIGKIADKELSVAQVTELLLNGRTSTIRGFKSKSGKKFDACLVLDTDEHNKHTVKFDFENVEAKKIKDVVCPLCGGEIVQTPFGFGCANYNKEDENSCKFSIGKMAGRDIPEAQIKELLTNGRTGTIRGFKSKTGKKFDARIALSKDPEGKVTGLKFDFDDLEQPKLKDAKCPLCGGDIVKTPFGYGCANYNKDDVEHSCRFMIGKIGGVKLNDSQVRQLLATKKTDVITGFTSKTGKKFDAPLKLNTEGQIVFDFPDRPQPVETSLTCPRCKEHRLKKGQWYYECECGFRIGHTVAQVPLSEEIMHQLFTEGRTRDKVTGFVSKAGNSFDAVLKYEDERIQFDFDARPSSDQKDAAAPMPWTEEPAVPPTSDNQPVEASGEAFPVEFPPDDSSEESMSFADEQSLFADSEEDGLPWN